MWDIRLSSHIQAISFPNPEEETQIVLSAGIQIEEDLASLDSFFTSQSIVAQIEPKTSHHNLEMKCERALYESVCTFVYLCLPVDTHQEPVDTLK